MKGSASRLAGRLLGRRGAKHSEMGLVRLTPDKPVVGRVLMSYATKVYSDLVQGKGFDRTHVSAWQNFHISRIFLDLGFQVDVMHFEDHDYVPAHSYDVVIDIVSNLARLDECQSSETIKILFPMFSHWTEHNSRSYARHLALARRRGVSIMPTRLLTPNNSVEHADHILCKGGEFGRNTYSFSDTVVTPITQIRPPALDEFVVRRIDKHKRNFVWLGGSGAVHKGLDLVLEAFASLPELSVTIIGNVKSEGQFAEAYRKELSEMPNIQLAGWIDTLSDEYRDIVANAVAIVAPSATELSCGSVIAGMMTGLVPVTTYGTDIDMSGIGISIEEDTVGGVSDALLKIAEMSNGDLGDLSHAAREASQQRYGGGKFLNTFRGAICNALGLEPAPEWRIINNEVKIPRIDLL